jgi:hypothetical protein
MCSGQTRPGGPPNRWASPAGHPLLRGDLARSEQLMNEVSLTSR